MDNDAAHRRALLAAHLRRLLATDEQLAQRPDNVTLAIDRDHAAGAIDGIAADLGLPPLPAGLPALAAAAGLSDRTADSLRRQQRSLDAYIRAVELQLVNTPPADQATLMLDLERARERRAQLAGLLLAFGAAPPPGGGPTARPAPTLPANSPLAPKLERLIRESSSLLDIRAWLTRLAPIERAICRVSVAHAGSTEFGTGFLVAPDLVMTNYHVVQRVIAGEAPPAAVALLFDYHLLEDGATPNVGPSYRLHEPDWLLDASPFSPLDLQPDAAGEPAPDQLDYALLRVAGRPGDATVVSDGALGRYEGPRGSIRLAAPPHDALQPNRPMVIVQHPDGGELKVAFDPEAVIAVNAGGTRVRYRTHTERGSSGSPCFDIDLRPVALHHSGDPNYAPLHRPQYNQGVPLAAILRLLQQRGKLDALGA